MKRIAYVKVEMVREKSALYETNVITGPDVVFDIAQKFIGNTDREHLVVLCLDTKHKVTAISTISVGTLNASIAHPREIFKVAILSNSAKIILAHNHPSGDPTPSPEDIALTKRVKEAGTIMGIELVDHVIVTDIGMHKSIVQEGLL